MREHGDTADYAVLAVAEAVLDLADAVRASTPPMKGPVLPVTRPKPPAPNDMCACSHTRNMHVTFTAEWGACRLGLCECPDFTAAEPWPNE